MITLFVKLPWFLPGVQHKQLSHDLSPCDWGGEAKGIKHFLAIRHLKRQLGDLETQCLLKQMEAVCLNPLVILENLFPHIYLVVTSKWGIAHLISSVYLSATGQANSDHIGGQVQLCDTVCLML